MNYKIQNNRQLFTYVYRFHVDKPSLTVTSIREVSIKDFEQQSEESCHLRACTAVISAKRIQRRLNQLLVSFSSFQREFRSPVPFF